MNNLITLKNIGLLPEIFLSISIIYLLIFGSILSTYKTYPLIQNLILNLSTLILVFCLILVLNDKLWIKEVLLFNNSIAHDYLSFISKIVILVFSTICLIMIQTYIKDQKINQFEYSIVILLSILGFLILCSANDFITAYLAIELQSLSFYVMASFKKNSSFSVEAGLKYFILGSFSSAILLFGISLIYCATGSLNFEDYKDLYCNSFPNKNYKNVLNHKLNFENITDSYCEYLLLSKSIQTINFEVYQLIDECYRGADKISQYEIFKRLVSDELIMDLESYRKYYFNLENINLTECYTNYLLVSNQSENTMGFELFKFVSLGFDSPGYSTVYNNLLDTHNIFSLLLFEELITILNSGSFMDYYDQYVILSKESSTTLSIEILKEIYGLFNPDSPSIGFQDELFIMNIDLNYNLLVNKNLQNINYMDVFKLLITLEHLQYEPNYFTDIFVHKNKFKSFILYNIEEFSKFLSTTYPKNSIGLHLSSDNNLLNEKYVLRLRELKIDIFTKVLNDECNCQNALYNKYIRVCNNLLSSEPNFMCDYQDCNIFSSTLSNELVLFGLMLVFVSIIFKLAIAPLHAWSPDVYEGSPTSSTLFFAVVSKLSLLVLLLRIFYHSFHGLVYSWKFYIVLIAVFSVMVGSFTALEQKKLKSLFAYSSTSHLGYIFIAFCAGTLEGIQSIIAYIIIYMLSSSCIWSILLLLRPKDINNRKANKDLADVASLIKSNSILGLILSTTLFSIAGFPPLIGFFTKLNIFLSSMEASMYFVAIISILSSIISTFYYIRIIKIICFENKIVGRLYHPLPYLGTLIVVINFLLLIFLFINPTMLFLISHKISLLYFY